jgi:hypothetical protein
VSKPKYSYDEECEHLARHFLAEESSLSNAAVPDLAQAIQTCIEDWFFSRAGDFEGDEESAA